MQQFGVFSLNKGINAAHSEPIKLKNSYQNNIFSLKYFTWVA